MHGKEGEGLLAPCRGSKVSMLLKCFRVSSGLLQSLAIRSFHRAVKIPKDVLENPFYGKYKKQLERVQG